MSQLVSRTAAALPAAGLAALLTISWWPSPVDRPFAPQIAGLLTFLHADLGFPAWFGYGALEFGSNVVLYAVVACACAFVLARRHWWWIALLGLATATVVELTQATIFTGRHADVHDVVANTLGALLGAAVSLLVRRRPAARG